MTRRGYCGIGVWHPKVGANIGTLIRSAHAFDVDFVFTIGRRYGKQASARSQDRHIPVLNFPTVDAWRSAMPSNARLIAVEITDDAVDLPSFSHPERAVYLLGAEDHGLSPTMLRGCQVVRIPGASRCLNVATAGSIVLYDRMVRA